MQAWPPTHLDMHMKWVDLDKENLKAEEEVWPDQQQNDDQDKDNDLDNNKDNDKGKDKDKEDTLNQRSWKLRALLLVNLYEHLWYYWQLKTTVITLSEWPFN